MLKSITTSPFMTCLLPWRTGAWISVITRSRTKVYLVSLDEEHIDALIDASPFYAKAVISADTYGMPEDANTVAVSAVVIANNDVADADVYNFPDINLERLKLMCPEVITVNSRQESLEQKVLELTDGVGVDKTFLAFGDEPTITQACAITRRAGQVIQHALMEDGIGFCYRLHQQHELDFKAFNMYQKKDFELICDALAEGKMDLSHFVTQLF